MPKLFDLVKVNISTAGAGTVTFGAAFSNAFLTPSEAGCVDGDSVRYILVDGTDVEVGTGVIGGSVTTMTRTVLFSKVGGVKGTGALNLSGTAYLALTALSLDIAATGANSKGHIHGLTLSNNATDATNDIDIAAGEASDEDGNLMVLASGITKRLDAAWAVGTGNGGLDTGTIADGTYHVWLIQRSDTGVVDALLSTSPSAPTMPTSYDRKRRIGAILRASAAILAFYQYGDVFKLASAVTDYGDLTTTLADTLYTLSVPTGVSVIPLLDASLQMGTAGSAIMLAGDGNNSAANYSIARTAAANEWSIMHTQNFVTNTAAQIRLSVLNSSGTIAHGLLKTHGWIDGRGR